MVTRTRCLAAALGSAMVLLQTADRGQAQTATQPSFRAAAELVVIDMVAVDSQGRFLSDLTPDDIDLREDGRRQPVQLLRLVGEGGAGSSATPSAPATAPPTAAPTTGHLLLAPPSRRMVIVIDALSLSVDAVPRLREALMRTVTSLPPDLPVLLATIGTDLVVRQDFTTDRKAVTAAIAALPPQLDTPASVAGIFDAVDRVCAASVDATRVVQAAIEAGERLVGDANARSAATSAALAALVTSLGTIEGRKHLVLYSAGHAISPVNQAVDAVAAAASACTGIELLQVRRDAVSALGHLAGREASDGLRDVIVQANRAQTTFYTLDPSGITTDAIMPQSRGSSRSGGAGPLVSLPGLRADAGRDYLLGLANETGGLNIRANDLGMVLERATDDARQYYLVGYAPRASGAKPGLRKISLSVKRRGVQVRYRTGYLAPPPVAASEEDRAISAAFANPASVTRDAFLVSHTIDGDSLVIEALIPVGSVRFTEVEGKFHASFSVHAELAAVEGRPEAGQQIPGKDVVLALTPAEHLRMTSAANLRVMLTTPLPARGRYHLTAVARDSGGWIAARQVPCCDAPEARR